MAEERLIDTDKDKKYRIRKNEDGEDELFIDESAKNEEEQAEFEVPEFAYDDEEAASMSPEQLHEALKEKKREEELRAKLAQEFTVKAKTALEEGDFAAAAKYADEGLVNDGANSKLNVYKLRAVTEDFSNLNEVERASDAAENVIEYSSIEDRADLSQYGEKALNTLLASMREKVENLTNENQEKKAERAKVFIAAKKRAKITFLSTAIPFAVMLICAIVFVSIMFSRHDSLFVIMAIVFGAIALVLGVITLIFTRNLIDATRKVKLNEKDTSTKLGRKLITESAKLEMLERIYAAINP